MHLGFQFSYNKDDRIVKEANSLLERLFTWGGTADVSPTTVEAVLGKMVKDGSVKKIGSARATKYVNAKHIR